MPISMANKPQLTGVIILFTGVALLAFTFINAFLFLQEPLGIIATGDLARVFGDALAPLIQACIRLMYLGIMGWIGSLLTVRGIPLVTHKYVPVAAPVAAVQAKPQPKPTPTPTTTPKPPQPQTQPKPVPQQKPVQSESKPAPKPQLTSQQPKQETQFQPQATQGQKHQPTPQPKQEEPKAILIPPENQREE